MRTLNLYICRNLGVTFALAVGIVAFVMLLGAFAKVGELLFSAVARGGSGMLIIRYLLYRSPEVLAYTIPVGMLVATVLTFNRLSSDHEITAMYAGGVSLLQVITPVVLFSLLLSGICAVLQFHLIPDFKQKGKMLIHEEAVKTPLALLEPGRSLEIFPGYIIYVGQRDGPQVKDISICVFQNGKINQLINAFSGTIQVKKDKQIILLHLQQADIATVDPAHPDIPNRVRTKECSFELNYGEALNKQNLRRRQGSMSLPQLFARAVFLAARGLPTSCIYMEINRRAALALAPFSLLLIGIPLGLRRVRKETSMGLAACLLVGFLYYALLSVAGTLRDSPQFHPDFLIWIPNILCQSLGVWGLWRQR